MPMFAWPMNADRAFVVALAHTVLHKEVAQDPGNWNGASALPRLGRDLALHRIPPAAYRDDAGSEADVFPAKRDELATSETGVEGGVTHGGRSSAGSALSSLAASFGDAMRFGLQRTAGFSMPRVGFTAASPRATGPPIVANSGWTWRSKLLSLMRSGSLIPGERHARHGCQVGAHDAS